MRYLFLSRNNFNKGNFTLLFLLLASISYISAQGITEWDNQLFFGNKVAANKEHWRFSGELQIRLKENARSLDTWFLEGVATYMINKHWDIVPDLRFSVKCPF